jgi:hypothetical protein
MFCQSFGECVCVYMVFEKPETKFSKLSLQTLKIAGGKNPDIWRKPFINFIILEEKGEFHF